MRIRRLWQGAIFLHLHERLHVRQQLHLPLLPSHSCPSSFSIEHFWKDLDLLSSYRRCPFVCVPSDVACAMRHKLLGHFLWQSRRRFALARLAFGRCDQKNRRAGVHDDMHRLLNGAMGNSFALHSSPVPHCEARTRQTSLAIFSHKCKPTNTPA